MDRAIAREQSLSRMLMTYIVTGLVFMLLPGTFLGVWNLIKISNREAAESIAPAWIQAHGHAQLFGWVGTFILGIGFYSIPKLRKLKPFALWEGWLCWALWVVGVTTRWFSDIYPWQWRILLPTSAVLEVLAFLIFFQAVASHRPSNGVPKPWESWIFVVIAATLGLLASLALNLGASIQLALYGSSPAFPHEFDQRYLIVSAWGFLVPMVWGFSSRWLPVFMGLRPLRGSLLLAAAGLNTTGCSVRILRTLYSCQHPLAGRSGNGNRCNPVLRACSEGGEDDQCSREFSHFHPDCLWVAADSRDTRCMGVARWGGTRNLGSIATRAHCWIYRGNGFFRRAENSAVVLWDACVVESEADASDAGAVDDWLHAPRRV